MSQIVEALKVTIGILFFSLINTVKSFLPNGVLPRKSVRGKRVLITGSGSGIGRLMAVEFGKLGAELVLWDINEKGNQETREMVESTGAKASCYTVDISNYHEINRIAQETKEQAGNIDILINNAGIVTGKKLFECPDEMMQKTMAVNANAIFYTAKNFLPSMIENDSGHIVTIASMAGKVGVTGLVDYCASKHAAIGCHDSIAMEVLAQKKLGVKSTLVCPFYINTGMFDGVSTKCDALFPILEPSYAVECIMEAILTDRYLLCMPKASYIILFLISFLPIEAQILLADFFGTNESMDNFRGRQQKKDD